MSRLISKPRPPKTDGQTPKARPEVDTGFKSLKNENKWSFSIDAVVENQLYEFGKLQIGEYPSQSFIFGADDHKLYLEHGKVTSDEID
ncbi:hypothetical protein F4703DRAFT_1933262 [Phycomyces blakesleeanus]